MLSSTTPQTPSSSELQSPFPPDSLICRVAREALVLLSGGRSVLLQLAHPLIAAGVSKYSTFQADPLARLFRTMLFMDAVLLDDERRPEALRRFHAMHDRIRGELPSDAGVFAAGTRYAGDDPSLKLWVYATFVDSCLKTYELFVGAMTEDERRKYFAESLIFAHLLEIPAEVLPDSPESFERYMDRMLTSDELAVTEVTRDLADAVLYPDVGLIPSASARLLRFVTAGLLPDRLRAEYGLQWSAGRQRMLGAMAAVTRTLRPHVPKSVWQSPLLEGRVARYLLDMSFNVSEPAAERRNA